jgi:hypothetical protein
METNTHTQAGHSPQYDVGPEHRSIIVYRHDEYLIRVDDIQDFEPESWSTAELAQVLSDLEATGKANDPTDVYLNYRLVKLPATPRWNAGGL